MIYLFNEGLDHALDLEKSIKSRNRPVRKEGMKRSQESEPVLTSKCLQTKMTILIKMSSKRLWTKLVIVDQMNILKL